LAAIESQDARVLVLGSLPGDESLRLQQYYAHPRNHFWPMLGMLFGGDAGTEWTSKLAFLKRHRIALWDVFGHGERHGSLDSNIHSAVVNDFAALLERLGDLRLIALNGTKAARVFERNVRGSIRPGIDVVALPSTSPVPGRNVLALADKIERWRVIRDAAIGV
jgi:hypoxanthine-DNA glycosylase